MNATSTLRFNRKGIYTLQGSTACAYGCARLKPLMKWRSRDTLAFLISRHRRVPNFLKDASMVSSYAPQQCVYSTFSLVVFFLNLICKRNAVFISNLSFEGEYVILDSSHCDIFMTADDLHWNLN